MRLVIALSLMCLIVSQGSSTIAKSRRIASIISCSSVLFGVAALFGVPPRAVVLLGERMGLSSVLVLLGERMGLSGVPSIKLSLRRSVVCRDGVPGVVALIDS